MLPASGRDARKRSIGAACVRPLTSCRELAIKTEREEVCTVQLPPRLELQELSNPRPLEAGTELS